MKIEKRMEFRILSKPPNDRVYRFRPVLKSIAQTLESAEDYLAHQQKVSPGWKFKIQWREVTTHYSDWTEL